MTTERTLLDRLRSRGEEVLTQISGELTSNPRFVKAMEGALRGKEKLEDAASRAVKSMSIPTRAEFRRALSRIDALEREVASLKAKARRSGRQAPQKAARARSRAARTAE